MVWGRPRPTRSLTPRSNASKFIGKNAKPLVVKPGARQGTVKMEAKGKLAQVTGSDVDIDPAEHYDDWAANYNDDLLKEYGYCAHQIAARAFAEVNEDRSAAVLDVGCGTGLAAQELARVGFETIDGVDVSKNMLEEARKTGVYRTLHQRRVGGQEDPPLTGYGGVICVGSFGLGHLGPEAMGTLIDMAQVGAPVVIFMNAEPFEAEGYAAHIDDLCQTGRWVIDRIEDHNYMQALDRPGKLIVARRA